MTGRDGKLEKPKIENNHMVNKLELSCFCGYYGLHKCVALWEERDGDQQTI